MIPVVAYLELNPDLKINIDFDNIDYIVFLQTDIFRERHYYGKQYPYGH
jgi:hypothetical protein